MYTHNNIYIYIHIYIHIYIYIHIFYLIVCKCRSPIFTQTLQFHQVEHGWWCPRFQGLMAPPGPQHRGSTAALFDSCRAGYAVVVHDPSPTMGEWFLGWGTAKSTSWKDFLAYYVDVASHDQGMYRYVRYIISKFCSVTFRWSREIV